MMIATNAEPIRLTGKIISDIDKCIYMSESNHLASTDDPRGIDGNIERYLIDINNYFNSLNENLRELKNELDCTYQGCAVPAHLISALLHITASINYTCDAAIAANKRRYPFNIDSTYKVHYLYTIGMKEIFETSVVNRDIEQVLKKIRVMLIAEGFPIPKHIYGKGH